MAAYRPLLIDHSFNHIIFASPKPPLMTPTTSSSAFESLSARTSTAFPYYHAHNTIQTCAYGTASYQSTTSSSSPRRTNLSNYYFSNNATITLPLDIPASRRRSVSSSAIIPGPRCASSSLVTSQAALLAFAPNLRDTRNSASFNLYQSLLVLSPPYPWTSSNRSPHPMVMTLS